MENGVVKKEFFGISEPRFHGDEFTPAKQGCFVLTLPCNA
jgi:hypothetical protein